MGMASASAGEHFRIAHQQIAAASSGDARGIRHNAAVP
jgi:hypothetical protein